MHIYVRDTLEGSALKLKINLSTKESHAASVDPCIVCSTGHAFKVILSFLAVDVSTCQLAVIYFDVVSLHSFFHGNQSIYVTDNN